MKNSLYAVISKLISLILIFIYTVAIAKNFGPDIFGDFIVVKTIITLTFVFSSLGNDAYLISEASKTNNVINFQSLFFSRIIIFIATSIPFYFLYSKIVFFSVLLTYLFQITNYGYIRCLVLKNNKKAFFASIYSTLISLGLYSIIYICEYKEALFFLIPSYYVLMNLFLINESRLFLKITGNNEKIIKTTTTILKKIWPIMLTASLIFLYTRIDVFMLSALMTINEVGIYSVASQLTEPLSFVISAFVLSIISDINSTENSQHRKEKIIKYLRLTNIYSLLIIIFYFIFGERIIILFYGDEFSGAYDSLVLLSISKIFVFSNIFISTIMIVDQKYIVRLIRTILTIVLNIMLSLIFITQLGMVGAAISVLITQFLSVTLLNIAFKDTREYGYNFIRSLAP
ncbi:oligosaccharide flippase family protein [Providencia rettgeri]|uniref:oligosaccharide flippase family protein n=1 Tax=Providencia rettgeri TaxID=587 RepID=UPI00384D4A1F